MNARLGWLIIIVTAVFAAAVVCRQRLAIGALEKELSRERAVARSLIPVRAEHERLLGAQASESELKLLAKDAAALPLVRAEVATLRVQAAGGARTVAEKKPEAEMRFAIGEILTAAEWANAGRASPQAALETALWAGAGGDVETFANMIMFINPRTQKAAQALWENLPVATRARYGSPESFIAFCSVRDVPLGSAQVRQYRPIDQLPAPAATMELALKAADGTARNTLLLFMNPGDGWKLVVTEGVIGKYAAMLKGDSVGEEKKTK